MNIPVLLNFIYGIFNGDFDVSKYALQWEQPVDPKNCFQWLVLWFIVYSYGIAYCGSTLMITAFFVGGCYYLMGLCDQFQYLIKSIDNDVTLSQNEKNPQKYQAILRKFKLNLCKSIDLHSDIFE